MQRYVPDWTAQRRSRQKIDALEVAGSAAFVLLVLAMTLYVVLHG